MATPINDWTGKIIGSTFENSTSTITPNHGGGAFCAIEIITAAVFNSTNGLVSAQYDHDSDGLTADTKSAWVNTNDTDAGVVLDSITIPAGTILHGRWTQFILASGSVIAYECV